jgi:hypothetical protein
MTPSEEWTIIVVMAVVGCLFVIAVIWLVFERILELVQ